MGWLGRGLGDFGSQVGEGYDVNLGWRERLQDIAMRNAQQKLADMKGPLELQELQQRIKQMKSPQPAGIVKGQGGETSGVTFDPATSTYSIKTLIPGAAPEPKFPTLQAAAAYYTQHGDWEKLKLINDEIDRNKTQKAVQEPKDAFELWRAQNPNAPVSEWLKLQEKYKKTAEGGTKTPFELWIQQHPKGTYDQWLQQSKEEDRSDAIRSVNEAMSAFKNFQSQTATAARVNKTFSLLNPKTWWDDPTIGANVTAAKQDFDGKRLDAIQKLTDAGMPIPDWLKNQVGPESQAVIPPPNVPPPPGYVPNRTQ